jgi:hypothetical protein
VPISITSRKAKGRRLQQWVCKQLSKILNLPYDQQDDNCLIHSREMGLCGEDVVLRGEAYEKILFSIECKNVEKFNLYGAIEQAKQNTKKDKSWLVIHKKNNSKPIAILDAEIFFELLKKDK